MRSYKLRTKMLATVYITDMDRMCGISMTLMMKPPQRCGIMPSAYLPQDTAIKNISGQYRLTAQAVAVSYTAPRTIINP